MECSDLSKRSLTYSESEVIKDEYVKLTVATPYAIDNLVGYFKHSGDIDCGLTITT